MQINSAVLILMVLVSLYLSIIEIYTVLFRLTGVPSDKAKFNVISLLTCCGYTTARDGEVLLSSRTRRRLANIIMISGYMFSVAIASSFVNIIFSLKQSEKQAFTQTGFMVFLFILFLLALLRYPLIRTAFDSVVKVVAGKFFIRNKNNQIYVLDRYGKFIMGEIFIHKLPEILKGKTVIQARLREDHQISVLTICRNKEYHALVAQKDVLLNTDKVVVFGRLDDIVDIFECDIE